MDAHAGLPDLVAWGSWGSAGSSGCTGSLDSWSAVGLGFPHSLDIVVPLAVECLIPQRGMCDVVVPTILYPEIQAM